MAKIALSLRDDIILKEIPGGGAELHAGSMVWPLKEASPGVVKALVRLAVGGVTKDELEQIADEADWFRFFSSFPHYYEKLSRLGYVTWSVEENGQRVARLEAIGPGFELRLPEITAEKRFVLSRFAYSRRLDYKTVVETPLKPVRLELHGWLSAALWGLLSRPVSLSEISGAVCGADPATVGQLLQLFYAAGVIQEAETPDDGLPEDQDQVLRHWEFHDLLFHSRTRIGQHDYPLGATFRFWPEISSLPACKPAMPGEVVELYRPDLESLKENDYPFTLVLEERCSVRDYASEAITFQQLGEFLYRSARVKRVQPADPDQGIMYEASTRLYPGGGSCHELEVYLIVGECRGLDPGLYHYDPLGHCLTRLCGPNYYTGLILTQAGKSAVKECLPQVVINITARFQRLSWKYNSIAYSLLLKDVGVLYQTMYLVATAMDLAPCALGAGHIDWLCRAAGLNSLEESPVGEFLLGSKRV
jgi:SagB-type dehydrogenase family enzyme